MAAKKTPAPMEGFEFFDIDIHQLDVEWVAQPQLYFRHARLLADARRELEEAKAEMDLISAELDQDIRNDPESFGLDKLTEAAVKTCVLTQKRYLKAQQSMIALKHKVDVYQAAVVALDHRKKALENLVDLHGRDYFSTPIAPEHAKEKMGAVVERSQYERARPKRPRTTEDD